MKTRIIFTKFWFDDYIFELPVEEKLVFLYFLTNDKANMIGIYEVNPAQVSFDTGIPIVRIKEIAKKFQEAKKIFFHRNWVCIVNHQRYQSYGFGLHQGKAFAREFALVPQQTWDAVKEWDTSIYTSIYTSMHTTANTETLIKKEEVGRQDWNFKRVNEKDKTDRLIQAFDKEYTSLEEAGPDLDNPNTDIVNLPDPNAVS